LAGNAFGKLADNVYYLAFRTAFRRRTGLLPTYLTPAKPFQQMKGLGIRIEQAALKVALINR
jgi:hypothetical protein